MLNIRVSLKAQSTTIDQNLFRVVAKIDCKPILFITITSRYYRLISLCLIPTVNRQHIFFQIGCSLFSKIEIELHVYTGTCKNP